MSSNERTSTRKKGEKDDRFDICVCSGWRCWHTNEGLVGDCGKFVLKRFPKYQKSMLDKILDLAKASK